jgi:hypothetical protein
MLYAVLCRVGLCWRLTQVKHGLEKRLSLSDVKAQGIYVDEQQAQVM